MMNERDYIGPQPAAPYTEDKRMIQVMESAETIRVAIEGMRQQRSELDYNLSQAEKRLASLTGDLLNNAKAAMTQRIG